MLRYLLLCLMTCLTFHSAVAEEDFYRFERYWPALQNPWYFHLVKDIQIDSQQHVYVANGANNAVQKYTLNGLFISELEYDQTYIGPMSLAIDNEDSVYVLERTGDWRESAQAYLRGLIHKYTKEGKKDPQWQTIEIFTKPEIHHFPLPSNIAVGSQKNVYVTFREPRVVNKYAPDGTPLATPWMLIEEDVATENTDNQEVSIVIDSQDNVYLLPDRDTVHEDIFDENGQEDRNLKPLCKFEEKRAQVCKYTPEGKKIGECWGEFCRPNDMTIDKDDNLYISEEEGHLIKKYSSEGMPLDDWTTEKNESLNTIAEEILNSPLVNKLLKDKNLIFWSKKVFEDMSRDGTPSSGTGHLIKVAIEDATGIRGHSALLRVLEDNVLAVHDIAIDKSSGDLFTTFSYPQNALKRFAKREQDKENTENTEDTLSMQWTSAGGDSEGRGIFYTPLKLAKDRAEDNIYVIDTMAGKVLKFNKDGVFQTEWGGVGNEDGQFILPTGIAVDSKDTVYVVDMGNLRIQQFDTMGKFLDKWEMGTEDFSMPGAIAIDKDDTIYIADFLGAQIKLFNTKGEFVESFGEQGRCNGLDFFVDIAIHEGTLYATDLADHRVEIFDLNNKQECPISLGQKAERGEPTPGGFDIPAGIAVDKDGTLYVADAENVRVQIFTQDCITDLRLDSTDNDCIFILGGIQGTLPDQLSQPAGLLITPDNKLYITDLQLNRIQIFNKTTLNPGKAIIIAGRNKDAEDADSLWTATQAVANQAYYTLRFKGFRGDEIRYLSAGFNDAEDKNQSFIHDFATEETVEEAFNWAVENNSERNLTLFMIDHGGIDKFSLSGKETLDASKLNELLNEKDFNNVKFIYEACHSGSFLNDIEPDDSTKSWTVIASAAENESAYLTSQGSLSLSNFFWGHIFNGLTVQEAFTKAEESLEKRNIVEKQTPSLKTFNVAEGVFIGNGIKVLTAEKPPVIGDIRVQGNPCKDNCEYNAQEIDSTSQESDSPSQKTKPLSIEIDVHDTKDVNGMWATISDSDSSSGLRSRGEPVVNTPEFELKREKEGSLTYQGEYSSAHFQQDGIYNIMVYTTDYKGNYAEPVPISINVTNALEYKAIIMMGSQAQEEDTNHAVEALRKKNYSDPNILLFSDSATGSSQKAGEIAEFAEKIRLLSLDNDTRDLVLFLFEPPILLEPPKENFPPQTELKKILDELQDKMTKLERVTVVCEGAYCEGLLETLKDKKRVVIAVTPENEAEPTFSKFFWQGISTGATVKTAFSSARNATKNHRDSKLDGDGDGKYNFTSELAKTDYVIGTDVVVASVEPNITVDKAFQFQELNGERSAIIRLTVMTLSELKKVWASVSLNGQLLTDNEILDKVNCECEEDKNNGQLLTDNEIVCGEEDKDNCKCEEDKDNCYTLNYDNLVNHGNYEFQFFAEDVEGRISFPTVDNKAYVYQAKLSYLIPNCVGNTLTVTLPEKTPKNYVQYLAVTTPDGQWYSIESFDESEPLAGFAVLDPETIEENPSPTWEGGKTAFYHEIDDTIPEGTYQLHLIYMPIKNSNSFRFFPHPFSWGESIFYVENNKCEVSIQQP